MKQRGLFDELDRLVESIKPGDPLVVLEKKIPWESFRDVLEIIRPASNSNDVLIPMCGSL